MKTLIESLESIWYIWALILATGIIKLFLPKIRGYLGEKSVAFFLSGLDSQKYKIINNIMLQVDSRTVQIDHIVVSNYGIFVIETKNYQGVIRGNEYDHHWTQVMNKRKEKMPNPLNQNYGHIQALKEVLKEYLEVNYISIVAFTTRAELKVQASSEVTYTVKLPKIIRKYITETIPESIKEEIYSKLLSLNIDNKENRKAHIQAIHNKLREEDIKVNSNICPKCGSTLVIKSGKYGQFKGCSNFRKCRFVAK